MKTPRGKYTGEKIKFRKARHAERQKQIQSILDGNAVEELPEPLFPKQFEDIQETYWKLLKSVSDPRSLKNRVYPLHLILHRVISGFLGGTKYIGVLFPKKRLHIEADKRKLGSLPTRKSVYTLLRRINWAEANVVLSPLWERLGHTPDLIVRRTFRNPKEILDEFREEQKVADQNRREFLTKEREESERSQGMSAAKAKRSGFINKTKEIKKSKKKEESVQVEGSAQSITI